MRSKHHKKAALLPPPSRIILLYAADGLAVWKGDLNAFGRPRTPPRSHWVPMFRQMAESYEGLKIMRRLAEAGVEAWRMPIDVLYCVRSAFQDVTFKAALIRSLEDFADTANEKYKITLHKYKPQPYPTAKEEKAILKKKSQPVPKPERKAKIGREESRSPQKPPHSHAHWKQKTPSL